MDRSPTPNHKHLRRVKTADEVWKRGSAGEEQEVIRLLVDHFERDEVRKSHCFVIADGVLTSAVVAKILLSIAATLGYIVLTIEITRRSDG